MSDQRRLRVMFVDDEARVLQGLQRMLRPLREEWDMMFMESGEAALAEMGRAPVDVVVSDMRMPVMNGAQLLNQVMRQYPSTVRLILSGQAEKELVHKTIGPTHQYLSKPCDADTLKSTIDRASKLRRLLGDDRLRQLTARMDRMPSLPALYLQLVDLLQKPTTTLASVGELVGKDLGMSVKLLQLVNSAFFALRRTVSSPAEAVNLLGIETIQSLVLSVQAFSQLESHQLCEFSFETVWQHSMAVSSLAKRIAQLEGMEKPKIEEAQMAGMMHDVGQVVLAANLPQEYGRVLAAAKARGCSVLLCEREMLGASHAEVGAYLLGLWGISDPIVEAVAYHHAPRECSSHGFSALTAVHVANGLHEALTGRGQSGIDAVYLNEQGLADRLATWVEAARTTRSP